MGLLAFRLPPALLGLPQRGSRGVASWTKADLRRLENAASGYWLVLTSTAILNGADELVKRIAARLQELGDLALVPELERLTSQGYLPGRANLPRECRAAVRLLARVREEGIPPGVRLPWSADLAEPAPSPAPRAPVPVESSHPTIEELRAQAKALAPGRAAASLARIVESGDVFARRADSDAFGETSLAYKDLDCVVCWHAWCAPAAAAMGVAERWAAEKGKPVTEHAAPMLTVWTRACESLDLPSLLDLRGLPASHGVLTGAWLRALEKAAKRSSRGCVVLVAENSWALCRLLT